MTFVCWLLVLGLGVGGRAQEPEKFTASFVTRDQFGQFADLIHWNGYTDGICHSTEPTCKKDVKFEIRHEQTDELVVDGPCHESSKGKKISSDRFKLWHDKLKVGGRYVCKYDGKVATESFWMRHRTCPPTTPQCVDPKTTCPSDDDYCVIHDGAGEKGTDPIVETVDACGQLPAVDSICPASGDNITYCPLEVDNLCTAIRDKKKPKEATVVYRPFGHCPPSKPVQYDAESMNYAGKKYFYDEPIHLQHDSLNITPTCPSISMGYGQSGTCTLFEQFRSKRRFARRFTCGDDEHKKPRQFELPADLFANGPKVYKFVCELGSAIPLVNRVVLANYLVVTDAKPRIVHRLSPDNQLEGYDCTIENPLNTSDFTVVAKWMKSDGKTPLLESSLINIGAIPKNDPIVCRTTVNYRICTPHRNFQGQPTDLRFDPSGLIASETVYDQHGSLVDVYYGDGRREIVCRVKGECNASVDTIEFFANGKSRVSQACSQQTDGGGFYGAIYQPPREDYQIFPVKYECKFGELTTPVVTPHAAFCNDASELCQMDTKCEEAENKFCVISYDSATSKTTNDSCGTIPKDKSNCPASSHWGTTVCPSGHATLCHAIQGGEYGKTFYYAHATDCKAGPVQMELDGKAILLEEPILIKKTSKLTIKCAKASTFIGHKLNCSILHEAMPIVLPELECKEGSSELKMDVLFEKAIGVRKLVCNVFKSATEHKTLATMTAQLVLMEGAVVIRNYTHAGNESKADAKHLDNNVVLNCQIYDELEEHMDPAVKVVYKWTNMAKPNDALADDYIVRVDMERGTYQCEVVLSFKSCTPHRRFTTTLTKEVDIASIPQTVAKPVDQKMQASVTYLDGLGDRVEMIDSNGIVQIHCQPVECVTGEKLQLFYEQETNKIDEFELDCVKFLNSESNKKPIFSIKSADFRLGESYGCIYGKEVARIEPRLHRVCDQSRCQAATTDKCQDENQFCTVNEKNETQECSYWPADPKYCSEQTGFVAENEKFVYCPGSIGRLCEARSSKQYKNIHSLLVYRDPNEKNTKCPAAYDHLRYDNEIRYMYEILDFRKYATVFEVHCEPGSIGYGHWVRCKLTDLDKTIETLDRPVCQEHTQFSINTNIFDRQPQMYKFSCTIYNPTKRAHVRLQYYMVVAEFHLRPATQPIEIEIKGKKTEVVSCALADEKALWPMSVVATWWTKENETTKIADGAYLPTEGLTHGGHYQCWYDVQYKSCSPYFAVNRKSKGSYVHDPDNVPPPGGDSTTIGTTSPTTANTGTSGTTTAGTGTSGTTTAGTGTNDTTTSAASTTTTKWRPPVKTLPTPPPGKLISAFEYLEDRFGLIVSALYSDGRRVLVCETRNCKKSKQIVLQMDGVLLNFTKCKKYKDIRGRAISGGVFKIDPPHVFNSTYSCMVDEDKPFAIKTVEGAFCSHTSMACRNNSCNQNKQKYCFKYFVPAVSTRPSTRSTSEGSSKSTITPWTGSPDSVITTHDPYVDRINENGCRQFMSSWQGDACRSTPGMLICPSRAKSQCEEEKNMWMYSWMITKLDKCPKSNHHVPRFQNTPGEGAYQLEEPVPYYDDGKDKLNISCHSMGQFHQRPFQCKIYSGGRNYSLKETTCDRTTPVPIVGTIFERGSGVYKLVCEFRDEKQNGKLLAGMSILLVVLSKSKIDIQPTKYPEISSPTNPDMVPLNIDLTCNVFGFSMDREGMEIEYAWKKDGTAFSDNQSISIGKDRSNYTCVATVTYRSCAPYRKYTKIMTTEYSLIDTPVMVEPAMRGFEILTDRFHHPVSMLYGDGHRTIVCKTRDCSWDEARVNLVVDGQSVGSQVCTNHTLPGGHVAANITGAIFEHVNRDARNLQCEYNGSLAEVPAVQSRICNDNQDECRLKNDCPNSFKFCVIAPKADGKGGAVEVLPCGTFPADPVRSCTSHPMNETVCPAQAENLCQAIKAGSYEKAHMISGETKCPKDSQQLLVDKKPVNLYESVLYDPEGTTPLTIACAQKTPYHGSKLSCHLFTSTDSMEIANTECKDETRLEMKKEYFQEGIGIYKLRCDLNDAKTSKLLAGFVNYLVVLGMDAHVAIRETMRRPSSIPSVIDPSKVTEMVNLECEVKSFGHFDGIQITYNWIRLAGKTEPGPKLENETVAGKYKCEAIVKFKTCSPHREFEKTLKTLTPHGVALADVEAPKPTPILRATEVYLDAFHELTDLPYPDGYTKIVCLTKCVAEEPEVKFGMAGVHNYSMKCNETLSGAKFKMLNVDIHPGVQYECAYGKEIAAIPIRHYTLCASFIAECQAAIDDCPEAFCLISYNKADQKRYHAKCQHIPTGDEYCSSSYAQDFNSTYCPEGKSNFCEAMQSLAYKKITVEYFMGHDVTCDHQKAHPQIRYKGQVRHHRETYQLEKIDTSIYVECPKGSIGYNQDLQCTLKEKPDTIVETFSHHCQEQTLISIDPKIFERGAQVYKLTCNMSTPIADVRLESFLVVTDVIVKQVEYANNTAICQPKVVDPLFKAVVWWTSGDGAKNLSEGNQLDLTLLLVGSGYQCHYSIQYRICVPHLLFVSSLQFNYTYRDDNIQLTTTSEITTTEASTTEATTGSTTTGTAGTGTSTTTTGTTTQGEETETTGTIQTTTRARRVGIKGYAQYFDAFGDPVSIPYTDGHHEIYCQVECDVDKPDQQVQLTTKTAPSTPADEPCNEHYGGAKFKLDRSLTYDKFYDFKCKYGKEEAEVPMDKLRLCGMDTDECDKAVKSCSPQPYTFCTITATEKKECAEIAADENTCVGGVDPDVNYKYCPTNVTDTCTLMKNMADASVRYTGMDCKEKELETERLLLRTRGPLGSEGKDTMIPFQGVMAYRKTEQTIHVDCHNKSHSFNKTFACFFKLKNGTVFGAGSKKTCNGQVEVPIPEAVMKGGLEVYKLTCKFTSGQEIATMEAYFVMMIPRLVARALLDPEIEKEKKNPIYKDEDEAKMKAFTSGMGCDLDPPLEQLKFPWSGTIKIQVLGAGGFGLKIDNYNRTLLIEKDTMTKYRCASEVTFKTCNPTRHYPVTATADFSFRKMDAVERLYDKFGDETELFYPGGKRMIECELYSKECFANDNIELWINGTDAAMQKSECESGKPVYQFPVEISERRPLYCKYGQLEAVAPQMFAYHCEKDECSKAPICEKQDRFCILKAEQPEAPLVANQCTMMPGGVPCRGKRNENGTVSKFCPIDAKTQCETMKKHTNLVSVFYEQFEPNQACPKESITINFKDTPKIDDQDPALFYEDFIEVSKTKSKLTVRCPQGSVGSGRTLNCRILREKEEKDGAELEIFNGKCENEQELELPEKYFKHPEISKLICNFLDADHRKARLAIYLVTMEGNPNFTDSKDASGNPTKSTCQLEPPPSKEFDVKYWLTKGSVRKDGAVWDNIPVPLPKDFKLRCHAQISLKICSPHRKFEKTLETTEYIPGIPLTTTSTQSTHAPTTGTKQSPGTGTGPGQTESPGHSGSSGQTPTPPKVQGSTPAPGDGANDIRAGFGIAVILALISIKFLFE